jgi:hypothetical protein
MTGYTYRCLFYVFAMVTSYKDLQHGSISIFIEEGVKLVGRRERFSSINIFSFSMIIRLRESTSLYSLVCIIAFKLLNRMQRFDRLDGVVKKN